MYICGSISGCSSFVSEEETHLENPTYSPRYYAYSTLYIYQSPCQSTSFSICSETGLELPVRSDMTKGDTVIVKVIVGEFGLHLMEWYSLLTGLSTG
mmetsp:Transcript_18206/g.37967  ORF Transcript_18206/g.37967 Transcript_18206/m.37967 type:complete len:97 (-) Transcript_18206:798-1088(-)